MSEKNLKRLRLFFFFFCLAVSEICFETFFSLRKNAPFELYRFLNILHNQDRSERQ